MTNLQRLVIGYIPENCKLEYIYPGHPKLTNETFIELKDEKIIETEDWDLMSELQSAWDSSRLP